MGISSRDMECPMGAGIGLAADGGESPSNGFQGVACKAHDHFHISVENLRIL